MSVTRMKYIFDGGGTYYIDLAAGLSLQERRLIRQKQIFTVHGGIYEDNGGSTIEINTAFNNWYTRRAINRAFKMWRKSISKTLTHTDGMQSGKWSDFKLFLDESQNNHTSSNSGNNIYPVDSNNKLMWSSNTPEWNYATIVKNSLIDADSDGELGIDSNPDDFEMFIAGGNHVAASSTNLTKVGVVKSWFDSRPVPDASGDPVLPTNQDPLSQLFNIAVENEERLDLVDSENDTPPYSEDLAIGALANSGQSNLQTQCVATTTSANATSSVAGFQALCGLLQVVITDAGSDTVELILDVDHGVGF